MSFAAYFFRVCGARLGDEVDADLVLLRDNPAVVKLDDVLVIELLENLNLRQQAQLLLSGQAVHLHLVPRTSMPSSSSNAMYTFLYVPSTQQFRRLNKKNRSGWGASDCQRRATGENRRGWGGGWGRKRPGEGEGNIFRLRGISPFRSAPWDPTRRTWSHPPPCRCPRRRCHRCLLVERRCWSRASRPARRALSFTEVCASTPATFPPPPSVLSCALLFALPDGHGTRGARRRRRGDGRSDHVYSGFVSQSLG